MGAVIDPDMGEPFIALLFLDTLGLYGPAIWVLYKDVCGEKIDRFLAVIRAYQLGLLTPGQVLEASRVRLRPKDEPGPFDLDAVCVAVKARLPRFQLE